MPSESRQAREKQKQACQVAIESRRKLLVERGVDKDLIPKDPHLKRLRAKMRQTTKRLSAVAAREKQLEEMALRKQQKLEAPPEEKPAASPEGGKKKKGKEKGKEKKKEKKKE